MRTVCFDHNRVGAWVMTRAGGSWFPGQGVTIGLEDSNGNLLAGMVFEQYNGTNLFVHCAIRKGATITEGFFHDCFHFCFVENRCKRITSLVDSGNLQCVKFIKRLGAAEESRMVGAGLNGGDIIVYMMTPQMCNFLTEGEKNGEE